MVSGHTFTVDHDRYDLTDAKILGRGSYGVVTTAIDTLQHGKIAIKRIRPFANDDWDARHTLREIRLMKVLGHHPNVITLYDLSVNEAKSELYMMMELMDCDLHQIIQSKQPLTEMHHKCFTKQMLEGVKAMHDVGIFHRDLKVRMLRTRASPRVHTFTPPTTTHVQPGNLLVSKDCRLRITDFGLARFVDEATATGENRANPLTEYVVTRWYRCPELLLAPNRPYNEAIDLWAIGCIVAELLRRKPLFPGKSHANQVQLIFDVMGYSPRKGVGFELSAEAESFLEKRCRSRGQPLDAVVPSASPEALDLVTRLLSVDPTVRPTAAQALAADFLKDAETLCDYDRRYLSRPPRELFDFEQEKYSLEELKGLIIGEVKVSQLQSKAHKVKPSSKTAATTEVVEVAPEVKADPAPAPVPAPAPSSTTVPVSTAVAAATSAAAAAPAPASSLPPAKVPVRRLSGEEVASMRSGSMSAAITPRIGATAASMQPYQSSSSHRHAGPHRAIATALAAAATAAAAASSSSSSSSSSTALPTITGNVLAASGAIRAPKTPSPKKMDLIMQKGLRAKRASLGEGAVATSAPAADDRSDAGAPEGHKAPRLNNNKPSFAKQHQNVAAMLLSDGRVASGGGSSSGGVGGGGGSNTPLVLPPAAGLAGLLSQISHRYGRGGGSVAIATASAAAAAAAAASRPASNSHRIPYIKNASA